jgi:hypothetical protein
MLEDFLPVCSPNPEVYKLWIMIVFCYAISKFSLSISQ